MPPRQRCQAETVDKAEVSDRNAARVLVIDRQDRVLLLRAHDPHQPDASGWWHTPGGGLNPGETAPEAARRELQEEIGLEVGELGDIVHEEVVHFHYLGQRVRQQQCFYVCRVDDHDVDFSGQEDDERAAIDGALWWSVAELRATTEEFFPAVLPELLTEIVARPAAT